MAVIQITSCSGAPTYNVEYGGGPITFGDVFYFTFTGSTPSGCYTYDGLGVLPIDDEVLSKVLYGSDVLNVKLLSHQHPHRQTPKLRITRQLQRLLKRQLRHLRILRHQQELQVKRQQELQVKRQLRHLRIPKRQQELQVKRQQELQVRRQQELQVKRQQNTNTETQQELSETPTGTK
jgi:hypothetical protein